MNLSKLMCILIIGVLNFPSWRFPPKTCDMRVYPENWTLHRLKYRIHKFQKEHSFRNLYGSNGAPLETFLLLSLKVYVVISNMTSYIHQRYNFYIKQSIFSIEMVYEFIDFRCTYDLYTLRFVRIMNTIMRKKKFLSFCGSPSTSFSVLWRIQSESFVLGVNFFILLYKNTYLHTFIIG